jgi:plasmid stabilization system protein ParE
MTSNIEVIIQPRARQDWTLILKYTTEMWGEEQADAYDTVLYDARRRIGAFPDIGHRVEGKPETHRELSLQHHVVRYPREPERVVILRIVSHRQRRPST